MSFSVGLDSMSSVISLGEDSLHQHPRSHVCLCLFVSQFACLQLLDLLIYSMPLPLYAILYLPLIGGCLDGVETVIS